MYNLMYFQNKGFVNYMYVVYWYWLITIIKSAHNHAKRVLRVHCEVRDNCTYTLHNACPYTTSLPPINTTIHTIKSIMYIITVWSSSYHLCCITIGATAISRRIPSRLLRYCLNCCILSTVIISPYQSWCASLP